MKNWKVLISVSYEHLIELEAVFLHSNDMHNSVYIVSNGVKRALRVVFNVFAPVVGAPRHSTMLPPPGQHRVLKHEAHLRPQKVPFAVFATLRVR